MLRKDMKPRISVDPRGKIKTGKRSEKGFPQSLDYFNIESFPELIKAYGEKPDKLVIMFPSDDIEDFYSTEYNLWGSKGDKAIKKRYCDGETCTHKIQETINGVVYHEGIKTECICKNLPDTITNKDGKDVPNPDKCKAYMSLKAYIVDPMNGIIFNSMPYLFESHSINTADNLYSSIQKTYLIARGKLIGIPFFLTVKMIEGSGIKYPIWDIHDFGSIKQINGFAQKGIIPISDENSIKLEGVNSNKQIEAPDEEIDEGALKEEIAIKIFEIVKINNQEKTKAEIKEEFEKITGHIGIKGCRTESLVKLQTILSELKEIGQKELF